MPSVVANAYSPAERKAALEAHAAEVPITDHGLIPVFRIPRPARQSPATRAPPRPNPRFARGQGADGGQDVR